MINGENNWNFVSAYVLDYSHENCISNQDISKKNRGESHHEMRLRQEVKPKFSHYLWMAHLYNHITSPAEHTVIIH